MQIYQGFEHIWLNTDRKENTLKSELRCITCFEFSKAKMDGKKKTSKRLQAIVGKTSCEYIGIKSIKDTYLHG